MTIPKFETNEEMIRFVTQKMKEQNAKSQNEDGWCQYRSKDGNKCALGHLISDEAYDPSMENWCPSEYLPFETLRPGHVLLNKYVQENLVIDNLTINVVRNLQYSHDDVHDNEDFFSGFMKNLSNSEFIEDHYKELISSLKQEMA